MASGTAVRNSSPLVERRMVWDPGLYARHKAAMDVIKQGLEDDRQLLLSYVVWPTRMIEANLEQAMREGIAAPKYVWR